MQRAIGQHDCLYHNAVLLAPMAEINAPVILLFFDFFNPRTETVVAGQIKLLSVIAKILRHGIVTGVGGDIVIHREIMKFRHAFRTDQMGGLVHSAGGTVDIPQSPYIVVNFKANHIKALFKQAAGRT